ncbi:MAG: UDP-N-acetylenolpyruvoylglucosamine reductase, partial [Defluviitaleaceae bacterium]|nr:UDP-N-acetylenolpyruvoylglucosamine reductase [Defluviitaleaceae bacterium]
IQNADTLVLEAVFQLAPGHEPDIRRVMNDLNNRRRLSQPLDFPSAGSTFKRPPGRFAGKLIEDSGLKGFAIGGAMVSEKHAGFVINTGHATAQNIFDIIGAVRQTVHEKFGVWLEPEVKLLGFEV